MILRLLLIGVFLLAGCAHGATDLPVCDGAERRPANQHGSILLPPDEMVSTPSTVAPSGLTGDCP